MQELFDSDIRSIVSVSVIRKVNSSVRVNIFTNAINEKRALINATLEQTCCSS